MRRLEKVALFAALFAPLFTGSACIRSGYGPPEDYSEIDSKSDGGLDADAAHSDGSAYDGSDDGTDADADTGIDECPDDDQKTVPGDCGCGIADIDSDSDGTLDCNEQCPADPNKVAPGVCGCGTADTDSDSDGTPNCIDPDDDGDTWSDLDEIACHTDPLDSSSVPTDANQDGTCDEIQFEEHKTIASDGVAGDYFGFSVSICSDGSTVIVGAYGDGDNGANSGSAYILERSGTTWSEQAKLTASDGVTGDQFGRSVSISGDGFYAISGALTDDDKGNNSGSLYIFMRSGTTWSEQAKLTASDGAAGDNIGDYVSINADGSYVIAGAPGDDDNGDLSGSAYIFQRSGTIWSQQAKLTASDGAAGDLFGGTVSISSDGSYVIIGACLDDDKEDNSGAAYIFQRSGTTWSEQAKLTASDAASGEWFGSSVSISSDGFYVVVGAETPVGIGSAYILERSGTTWNEQAKLMASDGAAFDYFGGSVSISGDGSSVIVGADMDDDMGDLSGSAYIFERSGADWSEQAKLTASDVAAEDRFGVCVSISSGGSHVIVGAWCNDDKGDMSGSAYIY